MVQKKLALTPKNSNPVAHGVGRRKSSVARVWLRPGTGKIIVNGLDYKEYFDTDMMRQNAAYAFTVCPSVTMDVEANVVGGGKAGQSDAVKLATARAFTEHDSMLRPPLKKEGLLTVDARVKERKKYGRKRARRGFQFVKR